MGKHKVSIKKTLTPEQAAAYMKKLAEGLLDGKLVVEEEDRSVTLAPCGEINIEAKAKTKRGKQKFKLELTWATPEESEEETALAVKEASDLAEKAQAAPPAEKKVSPPAKDAPAPLSEPDDEKE
ncbi:amphi-Trp domain-containing protein [Pseudodesulfovibrio cashew]|uniref:Amphi-Trp domain-containing protein n=1 Tax=Pseudodesulfovibrio cashew TaxID=2678688 RepID=A0A6I6JMW3_9BACT|nr:amphi-Trp domain-containing protein [Pseudodesulfovibrio cashew]QGY41592.1 amphi-Trp domain-containing protein [Pseudodesulfovibrio cashew]